MLRFTIRDVLWLTVVAALGLGWWIEYRQRAVAIITVGGEDGHDRIVLPPGAMAVISADNEGTLRTKTKGTR